jgi:hypothetical protein
MPNNSESDSMTGSAFAPSRARPPAGLRLLGGSGSFSSGCLLKCSGQNFNKHSRNERILATLKPEFSTFRKVWKFSYSAESTPLGAGCGLQNWKLASRQLRHPSELPSTRFPASSLRRGSSHRLPLNHRFFNHPDLGKLLRMYTFTYLKYAIVTIRLDVQCVPD